VLQAAFWQEIAIYVMTVLLYEEFQIVGCAIYMSCDQSRVKGCCPPKKSRWGPLSARI